MGQIKNIKLHIVTDIKYIFNMASLQRTLLLSNTCRRFLHGCSSTCQTPHKYRNILQKDNYDSGESISLKQSSVLTSVMGHSRCLHTQSPQHQEMSTTSEPLTHFGYQQVEESEKVKKVYEVFENVATSYDLMNDAMSAGVHRLWKSKFVNELNIRPRMKVLDMAGGTGDIAFKMFDSFASKYPNHPPEHNPDIVISDINQNMLDVGKERASKLNIDHLFSWVQANAEELPFEDESFDVYTIAFGIRNCTHIEKVLDEAFRVLKIGGRFSCLEFSHVDNVILSDLYDAYSFQVIPVMGEVLAKDWDSYQYLVESIRKFPKQDEFAELIYDAGFSNVRY